MMHARIYLALKARTIPLLPLFTLPCFSENCQNPGTGSLNPVGHHRLKGIHTGHGTYPSAGVSYYRPPIHGRSALYSAGRQKLPTEIGF